MQSKKVIRIDSVLKELQNLLKRFEREISVFKYLLSILIALLALKTTREPLYFIISLFDLFIIFVVSNLLLSVNKKIGRIFDCFFILIYNLQQVSVLFAGTYVSLVMLSNTDSIEALSGRIWLYVFSILFVVLSSFLPIYHIEFPNLQKSIITPITLFFTIGLIWYSTGNYSPIFNTYLLIENKVKQVRLEQRIKSMKNDISKQFYKSNIVSGIEKNPRLSENPNVILIFAEGLSQSIIDDDRQIMSNIQKLQDNSTNFYNYYNHTFATYAGISGQLYSGYQLSNYDKNTLVSLEDVFSTQGYETTFINTEPNNEDFTRYLENLEYDNIIGKKESGTLSDKEAFNLLFESIKAKSNNNSPFFITIYTFGTHVSLDSDDIKFESGQNPMLNKFYNFDIQFQNFLDKFNNLPISDDTILVLTTDHATYVDDSYIDTFNNNRYVGNLDKIPFTIYYKNGKPQGIDANGKNSLALSPTILDYLDIDSNNYFLGNSLFSSESSPLDSLFYSEMTMYSTAGGDIETLSEVSKNNYNKILEDYFIAKVYSDK